MSEEIRSGHHATIGRIYMSKVDLNGSLIRGQEVQKILGVKGNTTEIEDKAGFVLRHQQKQEEKARVVPDLSAR